MGCFTLKMQITCFFPAYLLRSSAYLWGYAYPSLGNTALQQSHTHRHRQTDPQQVSGDVALLVLTAQDGHAVPLPEGQLVLSLHLIVPQAIHHPSIHDAHLLLNTCKTHTHTHTHTRSEEH